MAPLTPVGEGTALALLGFIMSKVGSMTGGNGVGVGVL